MARKTTKKQTQPRSEYNVRIIRAANGNYFLGFVQQLVRVGPGELEWKNAPAKIRAEIAERLDAKLLSKTAG